MQSFGIATSHWSWNDLGIVGDFVTVSVGSRPSQCWAGRESCIRISCTMNQLSVLGRLEMTEKSVVNVNSSYQLWARVQSEIG